MKKTITSVIALCLLITVAHGQDDKPEEALPEIKSQQTPASSTAEPDNDADNTAWNPRLVVTLFITGDGQPVYEDREVTTYRLEYRQVPMGESLNAYQPQTGDQHFFERDETTPQERNPAINYKKVPVQIASKKTVRLPIPTKANLYCDDIDISVKTSADGESEYVLTCAGRSRIVVNGAIIDCDSVKISKGSAEIVNATVEFGKSKMTSDQLTLDLPVFGVATARFDKPLSEAIFVPDLSAPVYTQDASQIDNGPTPTPIPDANFSTSSRPAKKSHDAATPTDDRLGADDFFPIPFPRAPDRDFQRE